MMEKRAILSLYDKTGVEKIAHALKKYGYSIIATKGTAKYLEEKGIGVIKVEDYTQEKEKKRVKTLSAKIFGDILSIPPKIHIVVVDLYPFYEKYKKGVSETELIEFIDIGGVSLLRAAAKNYKYVTAICSKEDYPALVLELDANNGEVSPELRKRLAAKVFLHTSLYDSNIAQKLFEEKREVFVLSGIKELDLRYGENPHQKGIYYKTPDTNFSFKEWLGHQLSYNNLRDVEAAISILSEFKEPLSCVIKHAAPCGVARGKDIYDAIEDAYNADPISAYGGTMGINRPMDEKVVEFLKGKFFEVIVSPEVKMEILPLLQKKKKLKVVSFSGIPLSFDVKTALGGFLYQEKDILEEEPTSWEVVSIRKPSQEEKDALEFAWKVVKYIKSNAICITNQNKTLAIGGGQPNRVNSVKIALEQAKKYKGLKVLASDGFFPFRDSIDMLKNTGVTAVIEPGGSIRDKEVIEAANENNIALVFTKRRHFLH